MPVVETNKDTVRFNFGSFMSGYSLLGQVYSMYTNFIKREIYVIIVECPFDV